MGKRITSVNLEEHPEIISLRVQDSFLGEITLRSLESGDVDIFGDYLLGLSERTRSRFRPHPLDRATAEALCANIDYSETIRLVATSGSGQQEEIIAYFVLLLGVREAEVERYQRADIRLDPASDCTLAPSVGDGYQDRGLGSLMMRHLIAVARRLGRRNMVLMSGTHETNPRAIHFYKKHGFKVIGTFENPPGFENYDMYLQLQQGDH